MLTRSYLFVPGHREKMLKNSLKYNADALVWDLEESVPKIYKGIAREMICYYLDKVASAEKKIWVRINSLSVGVINTDLKVIHKNLTGIMLAKTETPDQIIELEQRIAYLEQKNELLPGSIKLHENLENALGVWNALGIACSTKRMEAISIGAKDFSHDIGVSRSKDGTELSHAKGRIILAAAIAKIHAVDTVFSDLQDVEGLQKESIYGKQMGFRAKFAIHPKQIPIINHVFSLRNQGFLENGGAQGITINAQIAMCRGVSMT